MTTEANRREEPGRPPPSRRLPPPRARAAAEEREASDETGASGGDEGVAIRSSPSYAAMAWMTRGYKASEYAIRGELMAWRLYEQSKVMELIDAKMQANGFDEKRQVMQSKDPLYLVFWFKDENWIR
uniref:Uncharacterized protein n=1 Tax=Oryza sativa subsp. japonica TaxID=39947 RepID=Q84YT8_ORYSJ|nr:hypothetical protein [Oryza sativa Japonica Group]